ncbi:TerB N-terminal domain-containing protein [Alkalimonas sp. MEB108]|uniref:TerB N-terminal domain-containing protein n=1 Tax=Alkalimonas cellulosilytica TaxID=3058395 RepID=A0ABU7J0C9_9GAMM|nr:TerB N-terminal domain-containing protein [Alkalimonas sp. MEB108]MEE1999951.1 TerB N-terminal domain-containing protein [Alkalimonas sp. MEB108]
MEFLIGAVIVYILYKIVSAKPKTNSPNETSNKVTTRYKSQSGYSNRSSAFVASEQNTDDNDDDDTFATFTIRTSFGREPEKSSNKQKGRWVTETEQLTINGRHIPKGFYYFGGVLDSLSSYGIEPSLIDETRASSAATSKLGSELDTDDSLGYWPSYATLSKACRGAYLDFLASDRADPSTPIGYVFIYFYGLERRIIENRTTKAVSDEEFVAIFDEVFRLNHVFKESRSFANYSENFMELMALFRPTLVGPKVDTIPETHSGLFFKVKLATVIANGKPVDADLALDWLKNTLMYTLKTPARRCESEFRQLFRIRFNDKFKSGFLVKPNKTKLSLMYRSASSGISAVNLELDDLPDPSVLKAPINKLIPIAEKCTEELNSYSRYLGKADASREDIAALMLLPKELVNEANTPVIETFKQWAEQLIANNKGLTTVQEFWAHTGMPLPKTINKKELDLLTNLATKAGFGIAPDQRFHLTKFKADGSIVLFAPGHGEFFEPSPAFHQLMLALRLGAMVATADNTIANDEELVLRRLIEHDDKLSPTEKNSLSAYLTWRLNTPANTTGLSARIETLTSHQIEFLKKFIISIALADGSVDTAEIKQIEKIYSALGLDKSLVASDIHNLSTIRKSASRQSTGSPTHSEEFVLDDEILAMHESDTSDAKSMLENIFAAEDEPEPIKTTPVVDHQDGLDSAHRALFDALIEKAMWPRHDLHELCGKLGLMVDGAIEKINDWAYEKVDAPVLDDNGDIYVDMDIVEELKG